MKSEKRLSKEQQAIVTQIRRMFARGEPLNITAVKRAHPELIKRVYRIKPFWGWKRALDSAGVDYARIKVQLEPYVKCEICGEYMRSLGAHVAHIHGVEKGEYRSDYPEAECVCEEMRAHVTRMKSTLVRHWEKLWSPEYVLDVAGELELGGNSLNANWIMKKDLRLHFQALKHFGNWSNVLRIIGLDPQLIRRKLTRKYPSKRSVIDGIRLRRTKGLQINSRCLLHGSQRDIPLWHSAVDYYGGWDAALRASGFNSAVVHERAWAVNRRYVSGKAVIERLKELQRSGQRVTHALAAKSDRALVKNAVRYFGSWSAAKKAARIRPDKIIGRRKYKDADAVVAELKRRNVHGLPINCDGVSSGKHRDPGLATGIYRYFKTFRAALRAADINLDEIQKRLRLALRRYRDAEAVVDEIKRRQNRKLPLNSKAIVKPGPHQDRALWKSGCEYFGSWVKALEAAGIAPSSVYIQGPYKRTRRRK